MSSDFRWRTAGHCHTRLPHVPSTTKFAREKRWERVICKLERRRVVLPNGQILRRPARDSRKFANNMSRRPTKVIRAQKHCHGLFKNPSRIKPSYYKIHSYPCSISLGERAKLLKLVSRSFIVYCSVRWHRQGRYWQRGYSARWLGTGWFGGVYYHHGFVHLAA